jgi:hypothetical protein
MTDKPTGVTIVALLTLLSAVALLWFFFILVAVSSVGGPNPSEIDVSMQLVRTFPLSLSILAFILSAGIFAGVKYAWYGSIAFWIIFTIYFGWYAYMIDRNLQFAHGYEYQIALVTALPLIYSIAYIRYFQTKNVKNYFHV